jgi:hypothetical protein
MSGKSAEAAEQAKESDERNNERSTPQAGNSRFQFAEHPMSFGAVSDTQDGITFGGQVRHPNMQVRIVSMNLNGVPKPART